MISIIGIGNPVLKDDAVGLRVAEIAAEELKAKGIEVKLELMTTTDFDVIGKLLGVKKAVVVDGILGENPGSVRVIKADELSPKISFSGTHSLTLATSIKLGYELFGEEMPEELVIVAVEVEDPYTFSTECSDSVKKAIPLAVKKVVEIVENWIS